MPLPYYLQQRNNIIYPRPPSSSTKEGPKLLQFLFKSWKREGKNEKMREVYGWNRTKPVNELIRRFNEAIISIRSLLPNTTWEKNN